MALNIKDPETDRLAGEFAAATGEPITVAVREAILARLQATRRVQSARSDLRGIIDRGRARQVTDARPEHEILGYGEDGLPS